MLISKGDCYAVEAKFSLRKIWQARLRKINLNTSPRAACVASIVRKENKLVKMKKQLSIISSQKKLFENMIRSAVTMFLPYEKQLSISHATFKTRCPLMVFLKRSSKSVTKLRSPKNACKLFFKTEIDT